MEQLKNNKGISLVELIPIVLLIVIVVVIGIIKWIGLAKTTEVEDITTDMITIKANAKIYAEEINAKTLDEEDTNSARVQLYETDYGMYKTDLIEISSYLNNSEITEDDYECYRISYTGLLLMKIEDENLTDEESNEDFYVVYNVQEYSDIEVIYKPGIEYNENTYYTLTSLQEVME